MTMSEELLWSPLASFCSGRNHKSDHKEYKIKSIHFNSLQLFISLSINKYFLSTSLSHYFFNLISFFYHLFWSTIPFIVTLLIRDLSSASWTVQPLHHTRVYMFKPKKALMVRVINWLQDELYVNLLCLERLVNQSNTVCLHFPDLRITPYVSRSCTTTQKLDIYQSLTSITFCYSSPLIPKYIRLNCFKPKYSNDKSLLSWSSPPQMWCFSFLFDQI